MNLHSMRQAPVRRHSGDRGVALVIVLFCSFLLAALLVAFFQSATNDRKSTALYYNQGSAKRLADTAMNSVIAQIREATSGTSTAWASQPGAIRCYDATGAFAKGYKLYTSETMVETTSEANMATEDLPPANWASLPGLYTDLNAPVATVSGTPAFPIIDGNGMIAGTDPVSDSPGFVYSGSTGITPVGFSTNPSAVGVSYNAGANISGTNTPVPMPVMWHYVLQDGRIVVPQLNGNTVTVAGATKTNPVIGRIAFWTDDECAKVNINTASYDLPPTTTSGGDPFTDYHAYHSPPFFEGNAEHQLGKFQPGRGEYQRFPGHPATTNLGIIFPSLTGTDIFNITPRYINGGSLGGTGSASIINVSSKSNNPLYATAGELLYSGSNMLSGTRALNPNAATTGTFTRPQVEQARFFVTARSRAPELNLFGKPRVAIWPVHSSITSATSATSLHLTGFDRLAAFCSSLLSGTSIYYMQREDSTSPTVDQQISGNQKLFGDSSNTSYLQYLTSQTIPGFGGNFSSKYGVDRDQILTEIEDYIRCVNTNDPLLSSSNQYTLTGSTVYAGSLGTLSAPPGFAQVTPLYNSANDTMGLGRTFTISAVGIQFICTADGSEGTIASPVTATVTSGTPATTINLIANPELDPDPVRLLKKKSNQAANFTLNNTLLSSGSSVSITYTANKTLGGASLGNNQRRVEAMLLLQAASPVGMVQFRPKYEMEISGLGSLSLGGVSLGFPSATSTLRCPSTATHLTSAFMFTDGKGLPARGVMSADSGFSAWNTYPFVSSPITVTNASSVTFSGGTINIALYSGTGASRQPYQNLTVNLPACPMPLPALVTSTWSARRGAPQVFWTFSRDGTGVSSTSSAALAGGASSSTTDTTNWGRLKMADYSSKYAAPYMMFPQDAVRGVAVPHGDYRLIAATRNVSAAAFDPAKDYTNATEGFGNRFYVANGSTPANYESGRLVSTGTYGNPPDGPGSTELSALPPNVNRPWTYGDWDTGLVGNDDGAYNNWPDGGAATISGRGDDPYYGDGNSPTVISGTLASPNRIMPSPGVFGSLPTGVKANNAWQTLLLRPYYPADATGASSHPGAASPPDYLLMDLFWMPVVEPYAISETFSTAGKINMNYQILPFTYIKRDSGLRAVIGSERVTAINNNRSTLLHYKDANTTYWPSISAGRYPIDLDATLKQFDLKFSSNQIFKSATEICTLDLIPKGFGFTPSGITTTGSNMATFWLNNGGLTGDNLKERPYANIYPRLTTKSNTYQVHYWVQSLKKSPATAEGTFVDPNSTASGAKDVILSEARGSAVVERYLDPNDTTLPDYTNPARQSDPPLDVYYKYRVVATREFLP